MLGSISAYTHVEFIVGEIKFQIWISVLSMFLKLLLEMCIIVVK